MSENTNCKNDIDDFIEYELTKECDNIEECDEDDVVEYVITEDEDEEIYENDPPKSSLVLDQEIMQEQTHDGYSYQEIKQERLDNNTAYITDSKTPIVIDASEMVEAEDDFTNLSSDQQIEETQQDFAVSLEHQPKATTSKNSRQKGPKRYMLFDDLVANIVDYDEEGRFIYINYGDAEHKLRHVFLGTPIVEFAISTERDEMLPVECGICPDVMHKSKLAKHLKTHLVEGESTAKGAKRYQCIYCEETYKEHKYLAGHARRHMGIRPYVCEPCKLYFSTKQDLRVHNQRRHMAREHICEFCGKAFPQNTQLKRHRESTHEKKRRFACPHCPKAYYKNFTLQEHIRHVHMGKRRILTCPFCGFECHDAHKMARHRKSFHLNQNRYECTICQEDFTDINYFDAHKRSIQCRNNTRRHQQEQSQQQANNNSSHDDNHQQAIALITPDADGQVVYEHYQNDSTEDGVLVQSGDDVLMLAPQQIVEFDGNQPELIDGQLVYEITIGN